ncbi:MAG: 2-oxoglutarate dehydrogenase complex dihydrolipoyllysine-residue succinyltransferase [Proteobacteria bacterium]|nr:2-oxoglutarate dehydrogenase complex dihydrolipoyllysine-residue succinyltransferase [Pseudomonadota bacterium]
MSIELKVPNLPESVSDATVINWHKKPGDAVRRDENLVDLETDKVVLEVPAPMDGVLEKILKVDGDTVVAQDILALIKAGAVASEQPAKATTSVADATNASNLSPSVRRLVGEHEVNVQQVSGTGKGGRVTKEDVLTVIQKKEEPKTSVSPTFLSIPGERPEKRVAMSRLRARIAERLVEAQHNAAMLTTFNEINLQAVMDLREKYKDRFEKQHGVKLGFMSFFTKAVIEALKRFPAVNASIDGTDIIYHGYYDIGIAVSTERGLVVPIVRDADRLSMGQIEIAVGDYAKRARDNKLTIEEMQGGTFTITNGGVFGSLMATPILNPPQVAILGMHKIEQRPVAENGMVVIRPMMYVALSYDHRIIDGKESVQFLVTIKEMLEDPARLILEV